MLFVSWQRMYSFAITFSCHHISVKRKSLCFHSVYRFCSYFFVLPFLAITLTASKNLSFNIDFTVKYCMLEKWFGEQNDNAKIVHKYLGVCLSLGKRRYLQWAIFFFVLLVPMLGCSAWSQLNDEMGLFSVCLESKRWEGARFCELCVSTSADFCVWLLWPDRQTQT